MTIRRLVLGTHNPAKLSEWKELIYEFTRNLEIISISEIGEFEEAKEDGDTFKENASKKAIHFAKLSGEYVFSDDGGYEVAALGGAPGPRSRRILPGGKEGTDQQLIDYILEKVKGLPKEKRGVKLTSAAAVSDPGGKIIFLDKESKEGFIAEKAGPILIPGYPFRSIHYLPKLKKTYAELTAEEHRKYNHKRKIARRLAKILINGN